MNTILNKIQKRGRGSGALTMVASGIAAAVLFIVAIAVVRIDATTNKQDLSAQDAAMMQKTGHGAQTTASR